MQRHEDDGIIISCDFCGTDWDQVKPMIEGHGGSVLCLECFKLGFEQASPEEGEFRCTICLRDNLPSSLARWSNPRQPQPIVCRDCINQAAGTFDKDPDVPWCLPSDDGRIG